MVVVVVVFESFCQEVIFDKERKKVSMMSSRFFEKHLMGYRRVSKLTPHHC